jgi:hypothetical protein
MKINTHFACIRSDYLRTRNTSGKSCRENQNSFMFNNFFFRKSRRLRDNVEKYCTAGQATDDNMVRAYIMLVTYVYKHTFRISNTLPFHCNNGCTKAPQYYVIRILPDLFRNYKKACINPISPCLFYPCYLHPHNTNFDVSRAPIHIYCVCVCVYFNFYVQPDDGPLSRNQ